MKMKFEHSALGILGCMIATLVGLNIMIPPENETAAPEQVSSQIYSMETAAGPRLSEPENLLDSAKILANKQNPNAAALWQAYRRMDYDFKAVVENDALVPRVALTKLPVISAQFLKWKNERRFFLRRSYR